MDRYYSAQSVGGLTAAEWEVLYLLYDALDQLRKMTLSFSELRYLATEHTEEQIRNAVISLLDPAAHNKPFDKPLIVQIPNLANLPIYRIAPTGRDLVMSQKGLAETGTR